MALFLAFLQKDNKKFSCIFSEKCLQKLLNPDLIKVSSLLNEYAPKVKGKKLKILTNADQGAPESPHYRMDLHY